MLNKILFLLLITALSLSASWSEYKELFITAEGRVIDKKNSNVTHSEAVAYGMYLAIKNHDMQTFEKIHAWYKKNLLKNKYNLICWKWGKTKSGSFQVLDSNNASDGDIWIAYDNLLAYEITKNKQYRQEALELMHSIKEHLLLQHNQKVYLLPGSYGFETETHFEVNLSYYLFFIFDKFYEIDHDKIWKRLKKDGIDLLHRARFSSLALNPDWISIEKKSDTITVAKNALFGYDALRIPLNILMSNMKNRAQLLQPYKNYIDGMTSMNVVFGVSNLKEGTISFYNYAYAHLVVYGAIERYYGKKDSFKERLDKLRRERKDDYYSYSLYLISYTF